MPIESVETFAIPGPALLTLKRSGDERGWFCETWNARDWADAGLPEERWVQDNHAFSAAPGTTRGLHFQAPPRAQAKLIQVLRGRIFDAMVDIRNGSPTYGKSVSVKLGADHPQLLYVPAGFAHGYQTLAADTLVMYKVTDHYAPEAEGGLLWSDPALSINWPSSEDVVMTGRDSVWPDIASLQSPFSYAS
ncbi:dTDP-4-dehydrorhamnose 3,5-epimerase [Henriciella marina]|uniref:dTDP-4-dehydrorhamnose 3,5-epimerase n=1 Tax=Henriciella marina TaxID=453851 RepID=UPI00037CB277|nr:dTDP-4-dehydrorhamnose 3,5-epimerase [Henriciella marina]